MAKYESDLTSFMREFLEKNPEVVEKQKISRATWWDKQLDRDERARWKQSSEAQPPYPYYNNP